MSMLSRVPRGTAGSLVLRRLAAVTGTTLLAATVLQAETAHGLAAPTTPVVTAPGTTTGAASSLAAKAATDASVGKLSPNSAGNGCSDTSPTVTCDLYASAGTQLVGGDSLPIWGFAKDASAAPADPGPNLVVRQGDTVTITLHNGVAGQSMSLAFPGLGTAVTGLDQPGVSSGGTATYTFRAARPGTFLYEAGQTDNQARQVAMGLAGALVVLPADQATTTDYQDEAVLVLSEIDPGLAAHPDTYDMRQFTPQYRLIDGKTFPDTAVVATNAGNVVKLHYVNAGQRQHPMTLLGATQTTTARDGHPLAYPDAQVTAVLEPGTTADALVTIPSDGTTKLTLYESGQHLDTAGKSAGVGSTQLAFGGMMTVLDTQAQPASTDVVGPKASAVSFSANPADGQSDVTVTATIDDTTTGNAPIQDAELLVDDPNTVANGGGSHLAVTDDTASRTTVTGTLTVDRLQLLGGKHTVYVRGQDANGNWGALAAGTLNVQGHGALTTGTYLAPALTNLKGTITINGTGDASATAGTVTKAEYYLQDDVGGPTDAQIAAGGTPMTTNRTATIVAEKATVPNASLAGLSDGPHLAWIRSMDNRNLWGPFTRVEFTVDTAGPTTESGLTPNPTNGLVSAPGTPGFASVSATVDDGTSGSTISDAEAFVNPADISRVTTGTGLQLVPDQPTLSSTTEHFHGGVPLAQLRSLPDGTYNLYVHGKDAAGNWGAFQLTTFQVAKTAPVLGTSTQGLSVPATTAGAATVTATVPQANPNNSVPSTWLGGAEFWWGTTDPGPGKATPVTGTLDSGTLTLSYLPVTGVTPGVRQLNVRTQDLAGNWSNTVSATLTVSPPTLVQEFFSAPLSSAWTRTGTAVSVSGGALQVSSGSAKAYVTSAASESRSIGSSLSTATMSVDVDAGGVTRAGWTTVLSGTGPSGQVFGLQVQRAAGGQVQIRSVMSRPGQSPMNGAALALPTGRATVTLAWRAGPKKATATTPAGLLTVTLNGVSTPVSSTTGTTSGLAVTGVSVGVVGSPGTPGLRQTLRLDNLLVTS